MMDVDEAISTRRSVRQFTADPVSATEIREILKLASRAPSIGNRQMWRFIVITDERMRGMLARQVERRIEAIAAWPEMAHQRRRIAVLKDQALHFAEAPAIIAVVNQGYHPMLEKLMIEHGLKASEVERQFSHPDIQSIGGMVGFLLLAAHARGYGACWMTLPLIGKKDLEATLELKQNEDIVCLVALGTPAAESLQKPRKAIDHLIEWH